MFKFLREYFLILLSGMFDKQYYLEHYRDVKSSGMNPLVHFIKYGWKENRNPSSLFNLEHYLEVHPELAHQEINPLIHFIQLKINNGTKVRFIPSDLIGYDYVTLTSEIVQKNLSDRGVEAAKRATDIIIFPIIDWGFRFQRPQQIARQLAKLGHRIFYINTGHDDFQTSAPLIKKLHNDIYEIKLVGGHKKLTLLSALTNEEIDQLEVSMRVVRELLLMETAIIKVDAPYWTKLVLRLKDGYGWHLVFDCMDLFTDFKSESLADFSDEELLLTQSDLVLTTSHPLYDHARVHNPNVILVPNAADFDYFHQAKDFVFCEEMKNLSPPIIGYYGAVANWFDSELIGTLASEHPEWTFFIVGHTYLGDLSPFENLPNVHITGERPYRQLIGFLSHFDVCIIPFKKLPLTQATNPVKLFEYLSAGKPVVATRLEEMSKYSEWIRLAETPQEWEKALQDSLVEEKSAELLEKRFNFARTNTWEIRGAQIEVELSKLIHK